MARRKSLSLSLDRVWVVLDNMVNRAERRLIKKIMKKSFRRISAVLTSFVVLGATMGFAAAAAFPAGYTTSGSTAVVYGADAATSDLTQANNIANYLKTKMGAGVPTEGDYVLFDKGSVDHLALGEVVTGIYPTLDEGELSVVLAEGVYLNDQNEEFEYTQEIDMAALNMSFFRDTNYQDQPTVGMDLSDSAALLNYTLDFSTAAEGGTAWADLENTNIEMLGKNFYISSVTSTSNGLKITLLDSANSAIVTEGEEVTVDVDGTSYKVSISFVEDANTAKLIINGEVTNSIDEGQTFKLKDGTYVGIKDVSYNSKDTGISQVEFSLGTGQIVLENGIEVKVNSEDVSDLAEDANGYSYVLNSYITNTSTDLEEIKLEWKTDGDVWIAPGVELVMPAFEAIKISMGDFFAPAEEVTSIDDSSDSVRVSTSIEDGDVSLYLLYANSSVTGFEGIGESSTHVLVTNSTGGTTGSTVVLNETVNNYFVTTWISGNDAETYVFEISKIEDESGKNKTTLSNLAVGGTDVAISEVGRTQDHGQVTFTLVSASDNGRNAVIRATPTGSGSVYMDRAVTKEGLQFMLPVNTVSVLAAGNQLNLTDANPTTWSMHFLEEDASNNIASGNNFNVTLGVDADDGTEPTTTTTVTYDIERSSDTEEGYVISPLATYVLFDKPTSGLSSMDISYAGDESYGQFYVSEIAASSSGNAGSMVFKDSEKSSWENKNVVIVGGSCINDAAATALGVAAGTCEAAFSSATGAGENKFVIQSVNSPFASGKMALVVAGYSASDTNAAVAYLTTNPTAIDTAAGNKYIGTVSAEGTSTVAKV